MTRVLFYVQHLLGIGHLVRATRIARALSRRGLLVDLAVGGMPVGALDVGAARLVQLPPVKVGANFSQLLDQEGQPFDEAARDRRRDLLLDLFESSRPDVVLIEAFPFGRRQMDFELLPLLAKAKSRTPQPLVAVSLRDLLQRGRKPARERESVAIVDRHVDLVLVHGDPRLARLEETFPLADNFAGKIVYTGLVAPDAGPAPAGPGHDVIVSAGGGAVGQGLIRAALAARALTRRRDARWLIVTGPNLPAEAEAEFGRAAAPGIEFARFVPDLPARLRGAALSISQAGYNTVADLLVAGCRSVLVPFAEGGETEQTDRARRLAELGLAVSISETELDAQSLAAAMERASSLPATAAPIDLGGADRTAEILARYAAGRGREA